MQAAVLSFSKRGAELSKRIAIFLSEHGYEVRLATIPKYSEETGVPGYEKDYKQATRQAFEDCQALIIVGATGIAVRAIAPCLKNKLVDPAVLSLDEKGTFIIPLVAGHIGGANELARALAAYLGGTACVTTATDVNNYFAVDEWAARNNLAIGSLLAAKDFAAALVHDDKVGLVVDPEFKIVGELPTHVVMADDTEVGMAVTLNKNLNPFASTVQLFPKIVHLGIGCRRNTSLENIEALVLMTLKEMNLDLRSIAGIASVDLKKDEQGLLAFAAKYRVPATFYTAEELNELEGDFTPSNFVKSVVGVSNVCERSAVKDSKKGRLILRKTALNGVTVAIAVEDLELDFNKTGLRDK